MHTGRQHRPSHPRAVFVAGLASLILVGCAASAPPSAPASATSVDSRTPVASTASASSTAPLSARPTDPPTPHSAGPEAAAQAWLLVGRRGESDLSLILSTTGEVGLGVPSGSPRSNWDRVVTAVPDGAATLVRDVIVQPGLGGPQVRIDGQWKLPTVGLDPLPTGRSLDGSTIVLVESGYDPGARRSRFAIVEHHALGSVSTVGDAPLRLVRIIDLPGAFEYDALSPDGRILYVVQHLDAIAGGRYQVRAIDIGTGVMRDGVIVDKVNTEERMAGSPIAQVRRPGGLVLTLYRGPERPFIHALNSSDAWAICIDLPSGSAGDAAASLDWGLAPSVDGASVFAVNASIGLAVEIDVNGLSVRRSASIRQSAAGSIVLAKFGHGDQGPVGRRLVASPDGRLLFAAGRDGVAVIRTADLALIRHDLAGTPIDALGVTPDGTELFALVRGTGQIVGLEAATGRRLVTVPGSGFDRLLAVAPW